MFIVNHRAIFFWGTGIIMAIAIGAVLVLGLPMSIDFTGGSLMEVSYAGGRPDVATLKEGVTKSIQNPGEISLRESGSNGVLLRSRTLTPEEHATVLAALSQGGTASTTELRFNSIGPALGAELGKKALYAIGAVILAIVLYVAWAFRRVSKPVSSWIYGASVVGILIHDVIVPVGFYAIFCAITGAQVDALFVVALLAILGYSVNDTIVIFDRIREHLAHNEHNNIHEDFDKVVGRSITETLGRSINTSLTVVLALLALIIVGSEATFTFAVVLLVGVIAGTYSSILVAAPVLIPLAKKFAKGKVTVSKK